MDDSVVKYDERGVMDGGTIGLPREMNRDIWLKEVFPEWGTYFNYEIDQFKVKPGTGALWYFGAMSCCIKSQAGAVFLIDNYAGEFDGLIGRLDQRLCERLQQEADFQRRALIFGFPQQVASVKELTEASAARAAPRLKQAEAELEDLVFYLQDA